MATLVWSAGRNEKLKHLLEFLRIRAMMMLTTGLLGLCLLGSLQPDIYCMWNIPQPSLLQHHALCDSGFLGPPFCLSIRAGLLLPRDLEVFRRISFSKSLNAKVPPISPGADTAGYSPHW